MNTTKFSNILLDKLPKKINNIVENVLDILFNINEFVRELNSIDFCNPLGYILTKSLPPEGLVDNLLKKYGGKVTEFINKVTTKLEINPNNDSILDDIEEIRLSLEDLILPEELKDIIPGGDGLTKLLQDLNDSLVITNTILSTNDKKKLIKSFANRLIPLSNPINLTEALISSKAASLNQKLSNFIKPERFRSGLLKLIKTVNNINKSILQIQNIVILINKIIKSINVLIKIFKISSKIIQKLPIPAKYVTSGVIVTSSTKVGKFETDISDLSKLLNSVSIFLSQSVTKQIKRIRDEIFMLLIGLNQLYENLSACSYFNNDIILDEVKKSIDILNNSITMLEDMFPSIKESSNNSSLYKGYNINILKEETTDNNTSLIRRRVIVTNSQDILEYEGTPTYASDDQILIKEGQFFIDKKDELGTGDDGRDNITDEEASILLSQVGMKSTTLEEASNKENEVNKLLLEQIQNNPEDKKLYNLINGNNTYINQDKVDQIKRIVNNINKFYSSNDRSVLLQNRLQVLSKSLIQKGYQPQEIEAAYKFIYSEKFNIKIINNNITISQN